MMLIMTPQTMTWHALFLIPLLVLARLRSDPGLLGIGLFDLPFCFSAFGNFRIPARAVGWMALEGSVRLVVAGFIIAAVLGGRRTNASM